MTDHEVQGVLGMQHSEKRQWRPYLLVVMFSISLGAMSFGDFDFQSLFFAGATIFILTVPFFADRWGRKAAVAVSATIIIIAGAILAGSVHVAQFIVFRFVSGAGTYMMISSVTLWMTEIAPPSIRGILVGLVGASLLFGYASSLWVGYGFYFFESSNAWRVPFVFQGFPALLLLVLLYWLPESPRWLMIQGRHDQARENLLKLHTPEEVDVEFLQIRTQVEIDKTLPSSYWAMFTNRNYRKRTLIGMGTFASIQTSGILVINNYGPMIYGALGFGVETQLIYAAAWLTLGWGGGCLALFVVDKIPRPKFIGYGLLACQACLIIEAALVANFAGSNNKTALRACVAMLFLFVFIYEFALDSAQFVYLGELFPTHIRAKGVSLGCGTLALMNVIWLSAAPTAFASIGWKFYLCFIIPGCFCAAIILYYLPDTLGLPLEEINAIFEGEYRDSIAGIEEGNAKGSFSDKSPKEVVSIQGFLLDILEHRATKTLFDQYAEGVSGTLGDRHLIEKMVREKNLRHVDPFKHSYTYFYDEKYGESFTVQPRHLEEVMKGLRIAVDHGVLIPRSLGELVLQRQITILQLLNNAPLSESASKQTTVKLTPQEMAAIASDRKSSLEEYLSLLRTKPTVLCPGVNVQFFSRPELVPDEKGRSLPVHTDKYIGPAVFETIYHAVQGIAIWISITSLLDLLDKPSIDKLYKSTILAELSNMCHFEYARTQALFKRQVSTRSGSKWFKRNSNTCDNSGNAKVSMKGKPEELTRSDPQLHYLLRLCQPETTVTKAAEWMEKLSDLYKAHPLEREKLDERESRTLHDVAAIVAFFQDLSRVYLLPSASRKKGNLLVAGLQEVDTELNQIKKEVDLRDYAAPTDNLLEPDELEKAFRNVEEQYQQAKNKANTDSKTDFVPIDTAPVDTKERIETRRQKEKTRPEHSSVYAITPITDSAEEKEPGKPTQPLKVSSSTAEVFATLFDKTQSRGSVSWSSFEAAMSELGFSVLPRFGSVYTFRPSEDMDIKRPVSIHRPH
ncbi:hypothetical protein FVER53590_12696 [Fusarium verticillioides]|nr:hypothetical protein FVER53590_12696 [Fusarium verticillioides]